MIFTDIRKGLPFIMLGIIASLCLIRGCAEITKPVSTEVVTEEGIRHIVFLKLKPEADRNQVIDYIKKIQDIEVLHDLEFGAYKDVGDSRSLAEYDIAISMFLRDTLAYRQYQEHPLHLQLKQDLSNVLAGPPVTYDFEMK